MTNNGQPDSLTAPSPSPSTSVALVSTIRNEQALLRRNLLYHRHLGIKRFYIFCDRTTDDSVRSVSDLDGVSFFASAATPQAQDPKAIHELALRGRTHSDARQCLNMYRAQVMAQEEGHDWVVALDPDELLTLDGASGDPGCLAVALAGIPLDVDCVHFRPVEVIARQMRYENVFCEEELFVEPPDTSGNADYARFRRWIEDPYSKELFAVEFLSHRSGKRAIKIRQGPNATPVSPHGWVAEGMKTLTIGRLLHYFCHSVEDFVSKFRNYRDRAPTFQSGRPLKRHKALWQRFVNDPKMDDEAIRKYFLDNIYMSDSAVKTARTTFPNSFIEIPDARRVFEQLQFAPGPAR